MSAMLRIWMVALSLVLLQEPARHVTYDAYAVRFGILPAFSVSGLVAGADRDRKLDIPVMVWLLKGSNGRNVLIDSGFYRQKFLDQYRLLIALQQLAATVRQLRPIVNQ